MSFNGADDHPEPIGPDDPRYYAPRSERSKANPPSSVAPQTRSDHLPSDPPMSRFDEMREKAFAKSIRPLKSPVRLRTPFTTRTAGHCGRNCRSDRCRRDPDAVLFNALPRSKSDPAELAVSISTPASATPAETTSGDSQALLQRFKQFHGSENPEPAASDPASREGPEKSPVLLEKFMQWQERK